MNNYGHRTPKWAKKMPSELYREDVDEKEIEEYRKDDEETMEYNKKISDEKIKKCDILLDLIKEIWGTNSNEYKYIKSRRRGLGFYNTHRFSTYLHNLKKFKKSIEIEKNRIDADVKEKELIAEAVIYLKERGKTLNLDYTIGSAIKWADEIAFREEVKKKKKGGGYIGFEGQNCDAPCEGWDMEGMRCQCGNRRVCWARGYGHSFKQPHVYAEAY